MKKFAILGFVTALLLTSCSSTTKGTSTTNPVVVATTAASSSTVEKIAQGKNIYDNHCNKCHELPNPAAFSDEKWVEIMNWMAPKARLTDEQKAFAYLYVTNSN